MHTIPAQSSVRIARPTSDLAAIEDFWVEGVGMEILWRTEAEGPGTHALLMVGVTDAPWHLELVDDPASAAANRPGPEDLLVVYLGDHADPSWLDAICAHGGVIVPSRNPYWDRWAVTVQDPDGYLLVLSHRTWS